jgi:xanthine dehydrogenase accessory factor
MSGKKILNEIARAAEEGQKCALATVIEVKGAAPGKAGFKLLIRENGDTSGTVGGGCTEEGVKAVAQKVMADSKSRTLELNLNGKEVNCGGKIKIFIEPLS